MCLARLQGSVVTPAMADASGETADVYKAIVLLRRHDYTDAAALHRRLSQDAARKLWEWGRVDPTRGRVLNALREFLEYAAPSFNPFRPGWDNWTGGSK